MQGIVGETEGDQYEDLFTEVFKENLHSSSIELTVNDSQNDDSSTSAGTGKDGLSGSHHRELHEKKKETSECSTPLTPAQAQKAGEEEEEGSTEREEDGEGEEKVDLPFSPSTSTLQGFAEALSNPLPFSEEKKVGAQLCIFTAKKYMIALQIHHIYNMEACNRSMYLYITGPYIYVVATLALLFLHRHDGATKQHGVKSRSSSV